MPTDENLAKLERELALRSMIGESYSERQLHELIYICKDKVFLAGDTIYQQGDASAAIYLITDGVVELRHATASPWRMVGQSFIGILDAIIDRPYTRTAVATSDLKALVLRSDYYFDFLEDNASINQRILVRNSADLFRRFLALDNRDELLPKSESEPLKQHNHSLSLVERLLIIGKMRPFLAAPTQALVSLAEFCEEWHGEPGTVLFEEGDPSEIIWMIARGRVRIERKDPHIRWSHGPGDLVENFAAFGHSTRQYTAVAETAVTILRIEKEDLFDRMEEYFDLMRSVLAFLAIEREQIMDANARLDEEL